MLNMLQESHILVDPCWLATQRVRLRQWQATDLAPFASLNADPVVMQHFPQRLTPQESNTLAHRIEALIAQQGWGFWAVDVWQDAQPQFAGFVGLNRPTAPLPFAPCLEIGWRLARPFWGRGLATEAATLALRVGFDALKAEEIVAFTAVNNLRSRAVMLRLGMQESPEEAFDHPSIPDGNPLKPHSLYRLQRSVWQLRPLHAS